MIHKDKRYRRFQRRNKIARKTFMINNYIQYPYGTILNMLSIHPPGWLSKNKIHTSKLISVTHRDKDAKQHQSMELKVREYLTQSE